MYKNQTRNWVKHFDFMLLDVVFMQVCFCLSYWAYVDLSNPYRYDGYKFQAILLVMSQLLVMLFSNNYQGIIRRTRAEEGVAVIKNTVAIFAVAIAYLFIVQQSAIASRVQMGLTFFSFILIDFAVRQINKHRIQRTDAERKKSLVLITSPPLVSKALEQLEGGDEYHDYFVSSIILLGGKNLMDVPDSGIPTAYLCKEAIDNISHSWVDEVFILQPENKSLPSRLMDDLIEMGMTVNYSSEAMSEERWPITETRKLGGYRVLTSSIQMASAGEVALKRVMDIIGGIVGCFFTLILLIFIGPAIYAQSPGPIFFKQERVGRNGKPFKMYKFRSMYLDAEERKTTLMTLNKIEDGMMFKLDDDPRIIGSEKKGKDGKPKGIGNFIRNTSIDEFPQFFNVLKGDMSLVGTRPPTMDEWVKYDLGHRVRMSIKPGITGLWQISGRSEITDFHEVVRLDREYIESWSLALDVKILIKTVKVVFQRKGAH